MATVRVYPSGELANTFLTGVLADIDEDFGSRSMSDKLRTTSNGATFKSGVTAHGQGDVASVHTARVLLLYNQTQTQNTANYVVNIYDSGDVLRGTETIEADTGSADEAVQVDVVLSPAMTSAEADGARIETTTTGAGGTPPLDYTG